MAFIHCHDCNWEQDDFWTWRYNPVRYFLGQMVPWLIRPRFLGTDKEFITKSEFAWKYGLARIVEKPWPVSDKVCCEPGGVQPKTIREHQEHTWHMLGRQFARMVRKFRNMQWWTSRAYDEAREVGLAKCPHCDNKKLCID